jgi:hypothetical protein
MLICGRLKLPSYIPGLLTVLLLCIFSGSYLCLALLLPPPSSLYVVEILSLPCLLLSATVNLVCAVARKRHQATHIAIASFVAVILFAGIPFARHVFGNREEEWFINCGHQSYDDLISRILENRRMLSYRDTLVNDILGRSWRWPVYARTNMDGSIAVTFYGRQNYGRAGYFYCPDGHMVPTAHDTNAFHSDDNPFLLYYRVTNDWYTFLR